MKLFDRALTFAKLLEKNQYELPKTYFYFGIIYDLINQSHIALQYCQLSLNLNKNQYVVRSHLSFMQMKLGHLKCMWTDFEVRHALVRHDRVQRKFGGRWKGENFQNKSLAILGEQGLGDIL